MSKKLQLGEKEVKVEGDYQIIKVIELGPAGPQGAQGNQGVQGNPGNDGNIIAEDFDYFVVLSQAEYDALSPKDSRTFYLIPEE